MQVGLRVFCYGLRLGADLNAGSESSGLHSADVACSIP